MSNIERSPAPSAGGGLTKEQEEKIAGVPAGGTTGQVLTKKTNTSYDDEWKTPGGGPPSGAAGGDLEGEYPNPTLAANTVAEAELAENAVVAAKIKELAVTEAKLAAEAVTAAKIATGAVTEAKLAAEAVAEGKLKALAVTAGKIAAEAVETAKIKVGAITEALLAAEAVTTAKIKLLAVTEALLAAEAVSAAKLKAEAVETSKIKLLAVTAATLAAEAVETAKIKDKAVTDKKLAGLEWLNVEAVNAKLEQTVTIQCAVFNGLVFMRGKGKAKEELAAKAIMFTLPVAARPATERVVYMAGAEAGTANSMVVKTTGECSNTVLLAAAKVPLFDGLVFSL